MAPKSRWNYVTFLTTSLALGQQGTILFFLISRLFLHNNFQNLLTRKPISRLRWHFKSVKTYDKENTFKNLLTFQVLQHNWLCKSNVPQNHRNCVHHIVFLLRGHHQDIGTSSKTQPAWHPQCLPHTTPWRYFFNQVLFNVCIER